MQANRSNFCETAVPFLSFPDILAQDKSDVEAGAATDGYWLNFPPATGPQHFAVGLFVLIVTAFASISNLGVLVRTPHTLSFH